VPPEIEGARLVHVDRQLKEMLSSVSRSGPGGTLSDDDIDRLASRVVERLSDKIVREIAWRSFPTSPSSSSSSASGELESGVE
jgi:hypothetical protein